MKWSTIGKTKLTGTQELDKLASLIPQPVSPECSVEETVGEEEEEYKKRVLPEPASHVNQSIVTFLNHFKSERLIKVECADPDKLDAVVQVNVLALTRLTRLLLPAMVARRRGGLLFVSSGYGLVWMPGMSVYIATKHYVTALSDALRCELQGTGVVVSQLCPGPVATEFEQVAFAGKAPRVPGFVQISAEDCARHGLRGLARSRALVVPGWKHQLLIGSYRLLPRPIMRLVGRVLGWALRRMQTVPPVLSPGDSGSRPS